MREEDEEGVEGELEGIGMGRCHFTCFGNTRGAWGAWQAGPSAFRCVGAQGAPGRTHRAGRAGSEGRREVLHRLSHTLPAQGLPRLHASQPRWGCAICPSLAFPLLPGDPRGQGRSHVRHRTELEMRAELGYTVFIASLPLTSCQGTMRPSQGKLGRGVLRTTTAVAREVTQV